jgi:hypothetical protein
MRNLWGSSGPRVNEKLVTHVEPNYLVVLESGKKGVCRSVPALGVC